MPNIGVVLKIAGAYIAFLIGSGFATGQEILQFFATHGLIGVGGCLIFLLVGTYLAISLLLAGHRHKLHNSDEVFRFYAGPVLGAAWGWYLVVMSYSVYVVMLAGADAVLREYLGTPLGLGAGVMALAVYATLFFGLHEMVDVIGSIGPLLVVLIGLIAVTALIDAPDAIAKGDAVVGSLHILRAAPNWWLSGFVYTAMCTTGLAGLLPPMGAATTSRRDLVWAGALGPLLFSVALAFCMLALLGAMPEAATRMIPMQYLAERALPALAPVFSWIVLAGIFTTAAPMLWISVVRIAEDASRRYRALAAAFSVIGYVTCIALPFDRLLNLIYPTIGWSGLLLIVFVLAKQTRMRSIA